MRMRTVIGTLLGLMTMLSAWALTQAQETDSPEPPKAAAPEPKGEERAATLEELQARKEKALRDLQLLEAQLAVKRAEAQKAEAEIRVFRVQHPDLIDQDLIDQRTIEKELVRDPEIADLVRQISKAQDRLSSAERMSRSPEDPSRMHASRTLEALNTKLRKLVEDKRTAMKSRLIADRSSPEPRPAGGSGEVERKLDFLIGELESLKRALSREAEKP